MSLDHEASDEDADRCREIATRLMRALQAMYGRNPGRVETECGGWPDSWCLDVLVVSAGNHDTPRKTEEPGPESEL